MENIEQHVAVFNDRTKAFVLHITSKRFIAIQETVKAKAAKRYAYVPLLGGMSAAFGNVWFGFIWGLVFSVLCILLVFALLISWDRKNKCKMVKEAEMLRSLSVDELLHVRKGYAVSNDEIVKVTFKKGLLKNLKIEKEKGTLHFNIDKPQVPEALVVLQQVYGEKFIYYP